MPVSFVPAHAVAAASAAASARRFPSSRRPVSPPPPRVNEYNDDDDNNNSKSEQLYKLQEGLRLIPVFVNEFYMKTRVMRNILNAFKLLRPPRNNYETTRKEMIRLLHDVSDIADALSAYIKRWRPGPEFSYVHYERILHADIRSIWQRLSSLPEDAPLLQPDILAAIHTNHSAFKRMETLAYRSRAFVPESAQRDAPKPREQRDAPKRYEARDDDDDADADVYTAGAAAAAVPAVAVPEPEYRREYRDSPQY